MGSMLGSGGGSTGGTRRRTCRFCSGLKAEQSTRTVAGHAVELDDGGIMVIVKDADDVFLFGDRVRVIVDSKGVSRVCQRVH